MKIRSLEDFYELMTSGTDLDELHRLMTSGTDDEWDAAGLPWAHGERDWTSLPTFGGRTPRDTFGVWSWDATRAIVGSCAADVEIVDRSEIEG